MKTQTKASLSNLTPEEALKMLKAGNRRFLAREPVRRDLLEQVSETSSGQFPFAVVLGCIDSRVPPELIFDQGIGDIFTIRIAGNFINDDILGSMEFAGQVVGSKHILVLGHTSCGAVQGAVDQVELGHLTGLVRKLQPAVAAAEAIHEHAPTVDQVAEENVRLTIQGIKDHSPILRDLLEKGEIGITGAMYDTATGAVTFLS
jgi:carbonic anhydrase